jgi:hypothetical protein
MTSPELTSAKSGDVLIAHQVVGDGPLDLIFVPERSPRAWPLVNPGGLRTVEMAGRTGRWRKT